MNYTSKVYIQIDANNIIIGCDGGYTTPADLTGWIEIDEGNGDRYNLCQSHYLEGGLYTQKRAYRWKYINNECVLRTQEEIAADEALIESSNSSLEARLNAAEATITLHDEEIDTIVTGLEALSNG